MFQCHFITLKFQADRPDFDLITGHTFFYPANKFTCLLFNVHSGLIWNLSFQKFCRLRLKCDGTRAETRIRLSAKRTISFKSAGASVQSTTGSRGVRISGSNVRYTMFRGSVKSTGYPLHPPVSSSLLLPCVTVCHHVSTGVYQKVWLQYKPTCRHHSSSTPF
jgi:hypothetical protein